MNFMILAGGGGNASAAGLEEPMFI